MSRRPEFIGIGAQKAGTSWIHACLFQHPAIFMPGKKEIHFFGKHYDMGADWYDEHFRACPPGRLAGEISPTYLYHPEAPRRIQEWNPGVKLIACLRNPVDRAVSAYRYSVQIGAIPAAESFETVVREKPAFVEHGLYAGQLERYLKFFDRDQLLITVYEDIRRDSPGFVQRILQFLGVDATFVPAMLDRKVNESRGAPRSVALDRFARGLAAALQSAGLDRVVWRLARSRLAESVRRLNSRPEPRTMLSGALRAELERRFAPDVRMVAQLLERDLRPVWFDYERD